MLNKPMTEKQNEVYEFIKNFIKTNQYSPTVKEVADHFGVTAPSIHSQMRLIKNKGYIDFKNNLARTIKILK